MSVTTSRWALECPDAIALSDVRQTLSWARLDELVNRMAHALLAVDLGPAGRVAVYAENSVEALLAHLAASSVGVSTVPVNFHLTAAELAHILEDSEAAAIFVGPETAAVGVEAAEAAEVPLVIGWRCPSSDSLTSWEEWVDSASCAEPPHDMAPLPYLYYTSGTTGRPKGTEAPPAGFVSGATVGEYFDLLRADAPAPTGRPALVVTPCYHNSALRTLRDLVAGTPVVVLGRFDPEQTLRVIERERIESIVMVPTHFQRLLALPEDVRGQYDVSSLSKVIHTGASCPVEVKRQMIDWWGPVLVDVYGSTESGTTNSITSQEWLDRPGSVGRTVAPYALMVIDENGQELPPGREGGLYFRDSTGRGIVYHNDPQKTREAHLEPGVFTLGDIGYADEDGYVYITDRRADMVVSGGVNLYPAEVEQVLVAHPGVADVAVIGVPNAEMGEELKALIIAVDPANPPGDDELDAFCRERLAGYKRPRSYDIVADIGRNTMGKVNKRKLRAPYWPTNRTIGG